MDPFIEIVREVQTSECSNYKGNLDIEFDKWKGSLVLLPKGHELQK